MAHEFRAMPFDSTRSRAEQPISRCVERVCRIDRLVKLNRTRFSHRLVATGSVRGMGGVGGVGCVGGVLRYNGAVSPLSDEKAEQIISRRVERIWL